MIKNLSFYTKNMATSIYQHMALPELEEIIYALQIPYHPPLTENQRDHVINYIEYMTIHLEDYTEDKIRSFHETARSHKTCHEPKTFIGNKDVSLMSDEQLVFLPEYDVKGKIIRYYCFDRYEDVPEILRTNIHPFTRLPLSRNQESILKYLLQSNSYPNIYVDELPEEINNRLLDKKMVYHESALRRLTNKLSSMIESVGLHYEAEQVFNFADQLTGPDYNLFLKHKPINQELEEKNRDDIATETLNTIINYITIKTQQDLETGNKTKIEMGGAIDEFMYMKKNKLTYQELLAAKGFGEIVKELYWKPNFMVEDYYPNGNIKERYYLNDQNKISGLYISFYKNGAINVEGNFMDNIKNGMWNFYTEEGIPIKEGNYLNDVEDGLWKFYYEDGALKKEGNFINGKGDGMWKLYYEDGSLKAISHFIDGYKEGLSELYFSNGNLQESGMYSFDKFDGIWKYYYDDNTPYMDKYFENGFKVMEKFYETGTDRYLEKTYWYTDNLKSGGFYEAGEKQGIWKFYDENENLNKEESYKKGILLSERRFITGTKRFYKIVYWHNGNSKSEGYFNDNIKDGIWNYYDYNGKITIIENYKNGHLHYTQLYHHGTNLYLFKSYWANGMIRERGYFKKGKRDGLWQTHYDDGKLSEEENYVDGRKEGRYKRYYSNGNLLEEGNYVNHKREGLWKHYDDGKLYYEEYFVNGVKKGN